MEINIGDKVSLTSSMAYLKTTDSMPMLRPPDLVSINETGEVIGVRAMDTVEVKFRRGTFLIPLEKLSIEETQ
tara:strand:- start:942 stop:1160 length:219 start_codon:yes stop_codon:yes gene_type:complete